VEWKKSAEEQKSGRARGIVYAAFCTVRHASR